MQKKKVSHLFSLLFNKCLHPRVTRHVYLIFWVYAIWLVGMNLTPGSTKALEMKQIMFVRMDYFYHCMAYLLLPVLYITACHSPRPVFRKYAHVLGILALVLIATIPEWMQNFVPRRRFNWWDMLANFTGLAIGTTLALLFFRIFPVNRQQGNFRKYKP